jgi:hypothetical protein
VLSAHVYAGIPAYTPVGAVGAWATYLLHHQYDARAVMSPWRIARFSV